MILRDLINKLKALPQDMISIEGFDMACSYREYYDELGLIKEKNVTVGRMLEVAQEAQGEIFEGYKGGEYQMK